MNGKDADDILACVQHSCAVRLNRVVRRHLATSRRHRNARLHSQNLLGRVAFLCQSPTMDPDLDRIAALRRSVRPARAATTRARLSTNPSARHLPARVEKREIPVGDRGDDLARLAGGEACECAARAGWVGLGSREQLHGSWTAIGAATPLARLLISTVIACHLLTPHSSLRRCLSIVLVLCFRLSHHRSSGHRSEL